MSIYAVREAASRRYLYTRVWNLCRPRSFLPLPLKSRRWSVDDLLEETRSRSKSRERLPRHRPRSPSTPRSRTRFLRLVAVCVCVIYLFLINEPTLIIEPARSYHRERTWEPRMELVIAREGSPSIVGGYFFSGTCVPSGTIIAEARSFHSAPLRICIFSFLFLSPICSYARVRNLSSRISQKNYDLIENRV